MSEQDGELIIVLLRLMSAICKIIMLLKAAEVIKESYSYVSLHITVFQRKKKSKEKWQNIHIKMHNIKAITTIHVIHK